jgi:hypothetical protein
MHATCPAHVIVLHYTEERLFENYTEYVQSLCFRRRQNLTANRKWEEIVCSGRHSHVCVRVHTRTHTVQPVYFCLLALNCNYISHSVHIHYHTSYPTCVQYPLLQLLVMGKCVNNKLERTKIEAAVACYKVLWAVLTWG